MTARIILKMKKRARVTSLEAEKTRVVRMASVVTGLTKKRGHQKLLLQRNLILGIRLLTARKILKMKKSARVKTSQKKKWQN